MVVFLGIVVTGGLAACGISPTSTATSTNQAASSSDAISSEIPTPTTPAPVLDTITALGKSCTDLISLQTLYDYNPNFGENPKFSVESGTPEAEIAKLQGTTCGYINMSSGAKIVMGAARLPESKADTLRNQLKNTSQPTDAYGSGAISGYFSVDKGIGAAQVVTNDYWIDLRSSQFGDPADAATLMGAVMASLGI